MGDPAFSESAPAPEEITRDITHIHASHARLDPALFASYVLRDEETGDAVDMQPMHVEWHGLVSEYNRTLIWAHVDSGKTQQLSIARSLWELGRNPRIRICIISNTDQQAQKICQTIARYIEHSEEYRTVFPDVRRAPRQPWTQHQLCIERDGNIKDPSVRTCGVHGNILGARIDLLIVDDILDYENTLSHAHREDLSTWFKSTIETRMTQRGRVIVVGTAWHRDDAMHRWARKPNWMAVRYPVMRGTRSSWPERWPEARIQAIKEELGPLEFNRQLMCIARSDEESRFKRVWIDTCLARGSGMTMPYALQNVPDGYSTYTGVDLGVRTKDASDMSVLFTIIVHPNGDREILDVSAGRWDGPEIVSRIINIHQRYGSIVMVENVAAQEYIVQFTKASSAVPVKSFTTTGKNINHPEFGLESLATEIANGKWIIPNEGGRCHPQVQAWIEEMMYYSPAAHPGDRLMASWFCREASRQVRPKARIGRLDLLSR